MLFVTPKLPRAMLHILTVKNKKLMSAPGGQTRPVEEGITQFWGVVMPISNLDWKMLPEGAYPQNTQKLYTDDPIEIHVGQTILDTYDGQKYVVTQKLSHNSVHPMFRFLVEGVEKR